MSPQLKVLNGSQTDFTKARVCIVLTVSTNFPIPLHRASLASANVRTNVNYENERTRDAFTHDTLLTSFSSFDMQQYSPSLPSPSLYLCSECRRINVTLTKAQDYAERVSKAAGPSGPLELVIDGEEHSTSAASEASWKRALTGCSKLCTCAALISVKSN